MARKKSQKSEGSRQKTAPREYGEREVRDRFERAVDIAVATKPVHKPAKKKAGRKRP